MAGAQRPSFLLTQPRAPGTAAPASTASTCESWQPVALSGPPRLSTPSLFLLFKFNFKGSHQPHRCAPFSLEIPKVPRDWRGSQAGRPWLYVWGVTNFLFLGKILAFLLRQQKVPFGAR